RSRGDSRRGSCQVDVAEQGRGNAANRKDAPQSPKSREVHLRITSQRAGWRGNRYGRWSSSEGDGDLLSRTAISGREVAATCQNIHAVAPMAIASAAPNSVVSQRVGPVSTVTRSKNPCT